MKPPKPKLPVLCSHCGLEDAQMTDLIRAHQQALVYCREITKGASQLRDQLEFVEKLYFDTLRKHEPEQASQAEQRLAARWEKLNVDNEKDSTQLAPVEEDMLQQCYDRFDKWTRRVKIGQDDLHSSEEDNPLKVHHEGENTQLEEESRSSQLSEHGQPVRQDVCAPNALAAQKCPFHSFEANGTTSTIERPVVHTPRSSQSQRANEARPRPKRLSFNDPISAEFQAEQPLPSATFTDTSAPVCPIRFLDQHSPEEVARYFENHKNELPRSHEVCVRRYQYDPQSVRQLDAKYGSLVSMIQGLGEKHQPWLPEEPKEEQDVETDSSKKVQKWAIAVSEAEAEAAGQETTPQSPNEDRQPRFDRPLRDIRVGESPNRPWGMHVPAKFYENPAASSCAKSPGTTSPVHLRDGSEKEDEKPRKCPFDPAKFSGFEAEPHQAKSLGNAARETVELRTHDYPTVFPDLEALRNSVGGGAEAARMVFNGPVFIGYPMQEVLAALKQSQSDEPKT